MADALQASMAISASGLAAQSKRVRVITENIANAKTTGQTPEEDPYRRKTISFANAVDIRTGLNTVQVNHIGRDGSAFSLEFDPNHPAADADGMVRMPNVDVLVEVADMREAVRGYEANLQTYKQARELISMTIDMLRR